MNPRGKDKETALRALARWKATVADNRYKLRLLVAGASSRNLLRESLATEADIDAAIRWIESVSVSVESVEQPL